MAPETKITIKILRIITIKTPAGDSQINRRRTNRFTLGARVYKILVPAPHNAQSLSYASCRDGGAAPTWEPWPWKAGVRAGGVSWQRTRGTVTPLSPSPGKCLSVVGFPPASSQKDIKTG